MAALTIIPLVLLILGGAIPPARYDHPYPGVVNVTYLPPDKLMQVGGQVEHPGAILLGCTTAVGPKSVYHVYISTQAPNPQEVLRHERGHCNGWPGDHPA